MRIFMILVTLGAAGAGYVYLNRTPGEPDAAESGSSPLLDWSRNFASISRVSATELVQQIHEHTRSVLDDMTRQSDKHSDVAVNDAFQRLQQVTQTPILASNIDETSALESTTPAKNPIVPLPSIDELQRTAFDSSSDNESTIQSAQVRDEAVSKDSTSASLPKSNPLESTAAPVRPASPRLGGSSPATTTTPVTNATRTKAKTDAKQTANKKAPASNGGKALYEWKVVGKTTQGLPLHTVHLGNGGTRTLVIAGLSGDDRTAVRWLELLVDEVARHPEFLENNEVVFFRAGNPDGLVHLRKENSRGVLINRNFPGRRYRPAAETPKFAVPASELETRVILDTLYTFRPRRVIHLATTTGRVEVLYNRLAKNAALEFENSAKINVTPLDSELYPGSLEDFAEGTLEAAVLSMRLSPGNDWNQAWMKLRPHLTTAVVGRSGDGSWNDAEQIFDPDRTPLQPPGAEPISRLPARRGYEELAPPPE